MNYSINIQSHELKEAVLIINEQLAEKLNIRKKKRLAISFGTQRHFVDIRLSSDSNESIIYLSSEVIDSLHLPIYPKFEIRTKGNELILGPSIGILASHKYEDITKRRLKEISMNTLAYSRINGAIIVFSLDRVNKLKRLVEGYCYNAETDTWEKGIFPYPLAIYRRAYLNDSWKNHFLTALGDTVFSNYSFGKWEMHQWFSEEPELISYLPETRIYNSSEELIAMLEKYEVLYVKPTWGMKGFGVIKVSKIDNKINLQYREEDENKDITLKSSKEIESTFKKLFEPGGHIIQQGLNLIKYDGGIVDFRCVMQKNEANKWINNGIIARIGAKESVVSNISSGGSALPAMDLISKSLELSSTDNYLLKEKITSLCTKVCKTLDEYGFNFGVLGLDIGIDTSLNIWLIEVNNRNPHPAIALRASDIPVYYTILTGPLYYAKALAGFGSKEEYSDVLQNQFN